MICNFSRLGGCTDDELYDAKMFQITGKPLLGKQIFNIYHCFLGVDENLSLNIEKWQIYAI